MTEMVYRPADDAPVEPLVPRWWRTVDRVSIFAVVLLFLTGILLGEAASPILAARRGLDAFHYVTRQAVFGGLAIFLMIFISMMSPVFIRRWSVAICGLVLASVALLPLLGTDFGKGAVRWYSLGFTSVQPSEFLKPVYVVTTAWLMSASFDRKGPPGLLLSFLLTVFIALLLAMQPDFGQAALISFVWGVMYFVAGASMLLIMVLGAGTLVAAYAAYVSSAHFARRIDAFFDTTIDPTTQIGHAASAIREGGFFGVGIGEGTIKQTLPDAYTDFIIAVAAEEYGVVLCFVIMTLFLTVVVRSLANLLRERDVFIRLAGTGLAVMFGLQALINIGVAVRVLPAKGMTLPFVSYGGSSLLASGIGLGLLLALSRKRPQDEFEDIFGVAR